MNRRLGVVAAASMALVIGSAAGAGACAAGMPVRQMGVRPHGIIQAFAISPDGKRLAEIVDGGAISHIIIRSLEGPRQVRQIDSGAGLSSLIWLTNRAIAFVVPGRQGGIVEQDIRDRKVTILRAGGRGIGNLVFDPRTRSLAYERAVPWSWNGRVSLPVRPDESPLQFLFPRWCQLMISSVGVLRLRRGTEPAVERPLSVPSSTSPVAQLAWRKGHVLVLRASWNSFRTRMVDGQTGRNVSVRWPLLYRVGNLGVSPGGRLAVTSLRLWTDRARPMCGCTGRWGLYVLGHGGAVHPVRVLAGQVIYISHIWWAGEHRIFAQVLGADTPGGGWYWKLVEVDWRRNRVIRAFRWPHGDLGALDSPCSLDEARSRAVCVAQTLSSPPTLTEVDLRTGAMRALDQVNPAQRPLDFKFKEVKVSGGRGKVATGFLALPKRARSRAVPLDVMLYGFDEEYSRRAQWITSYPVARLVHSGIAVLLLNFVTASNPGRASFRTTRENLGTAMSLMANALPAVRATGVKISRAMIMGWSAGGMYAAHAIQELHEYVAAQVGDPAVWNTTGYALANRMYQKYLNLTFGGPPTRWHIGHYLALDPAADGKPAHGPILLEFCARNPVVGQFLEEWRAVGTQVQAFVYHRSVHWLNVPAEARVSRERNLDWAKLNLLGPQSVSPVELRKVGLVVPAHGWWTHRSRPERVWRGRHAEG